VFSVVISGNNVSGNNVTDDVVTLDVVVAAIDVTSVRSGVMAIVVDRCISRISDTDLSLHVSSLLQQALRQDLYQLKLFIKCLNKHHFYVLDSNKYFIKKSYSWCTAEDN